MRTAKVTIGGKQYTLEPLSMKKSRDWRKKLEGPIDQIMAMVNNAGDLDFEKLTNIPEIVELAKGASGVLIDAPDIVFDLLLSYNSELAADREALEETAIADEVLEAFIECIKLTYPLAILTKLLGRKKAQTS